MEQISRMREKGSKPSEPKNLGSHATAIERREKQCEDKPEPSCDTAPNGYVKVRDLRSSNSGKNLYITNLDTLSSVMQEKKLLRDILSFNRQQVITPSDKKRPEESRQSSEFVLIANPHTQSQDSLLPHARTQLRFDSEGSLVKVAPQTLDGQKAAHRREDSDCRSRVMQIDLDEFSDQKEGYSRHPQRTCTPTALVKKTIGTQTDKQRNHFLCSHCMNSHQSGQMSFGTTPNNKHTDPSTGHELYSFSNKDTRGPIASTIYDSFIKQREGFRAKNANFSSNPSLDGSGNYRRSPIKITQKSYLLQFENKKNFYENSDIKYFTRERAKRFDSEMKNRLLANKQPLSVALKIAKDKVFPQNASHLTTNKRQKSMDQFPTRSENAGNIFKRGSIRSKNSSFEDSPTGSNKMGYYHLPDPKAVLKIGKKSGFFDNRSFKPIDLKIDLSDIHWREKDQVLDDFEPGVSFTLKKVEDRPKPTLSQKQARKLCY